MAIFRKYLEISTLIFATLKNSTLFRYLRSTSQQEGGFHSDAIARFVMGHNMGPKLTQAVLWNYIGRFNTKVLQ